VLLVTPKAGLNAAFFQLPFASEPASGFQHGLAARLRRPPRFMCSWRCSCLRNIRREEPLFAGKVTCGVRNETSGQSWRSNTVVTNLFTAQNRNSKYGSGIQHKRLGG